MKLKMKFYVGILCMMSMLIKVKANTAKYVCGKAADNKGQFQITDISVTNAVEKVFAKGKLTTCGTGVTANGNDAIKITGTVAGTGPFAVTVHAEDHKVACGVDATTPTAVTLTIYTQVDATVLRSDDVFFKFVCDFSSAYQQVSKTASGLTVAGDPSVEGTAEIDIPMRLEVYDTEQPPAATTQAMFGKFYNLRATLTDTGKLVKTCRMKSCIAGSNAKFDASTTTSNMYNDDGCGDTTSTVVAGGDKFTVNTGHTTANERQYQSANFKAFNFGTSDAVFFQCTCQGCVDQDTSCEANLICPGPGRKRRNVPNNSTNANARAVYWIVSTIQSRNPTAKKTGCEQVEANCLSHVSFISIVAILALLLLISLGVSVFFCTKLTRSKSQTKMEAYPNPGYKA